MKQEKLPYFIFGFLSCLLLFPLLNTIQISSDKDFKDNNARKLFNAQVKPAKATDKALPKRDKNFQILLYTTTWKNKYWNTQKERGNKAFVDMKCPVTNCDLVALDDNLEKDTSSYDALAFHLPNLANVPKIPERKPNQVYIMMSHEAPIFSFGMNGKTPEKLDGFFNWTWNYKLDSDIFIPYGQLRRKHSQQEMAKDPYWNFNYYPDTKAMEADWEAFKRGPGVKDPNVLKRFKSTPILASWVVSHCTTPSKRGAYVDELRKHMDVEMYGHCTQNKTRHSCDLECYRDLMLHSKFYLAFENSMCKDYYTEKLSKRFRSENPIPVVLGGANYKKTFPPNSYIDVTDYKSPKDLADYLHYLSKNETAYASYYWWQEQYSMFYEPILGGSFCEVCRKLNDPNTPKKVIHDFKKVWSQEEDCKPPELFPNLGWLKDKKNS